MQYILVKIDEIRLKIQKNTATALAQLILPGLLNKAQLYDIDFVPTSFDRVCPNAWQQFYLLLAASHISSPPVQNERKNNCFQSFLNFQSSAFFKFPKYFWNSG